MAKMSRDKGKRGELEAAHFMEEHWGIQAHRGKQFQGGEDSPDVKTSIAGVCFEVKRREVLGLYPAMEKATDDCGEDEIPAVLHRRNYKPWLLIIRAKDLRKFVVDYLNAIGIEVPDFTGDLF